MIDLTPLEVRQKKGDFRRALRGYDRALVDDFLDLVAERMEELVRANLSLTDQVERLREQVKDFRERERALTEALVTAQEVREEMKRQATKDADLLVKEAEVEAERIRAAAAQAREREEETLRRLRARRAQLLRSYRAFLERELGELSIVEDTLELTGTASPPLAGPAEAEERGPLREAAGAAGEGEGGRSDELDQEIDALLSNLEGEP